MNPNAPEFQLPLKKNTKSKPREVTRPRKAKDFIDQSVKTKESSLNNLKNAWSNPVKSVLIAQLPAKQPQEVKIEVKSEPREVRVLPQPVVRGQDEGWETVGKKGKVEVKETKEVTEVKKLDLTEEQLEVLRQQRRDRRKREKEAKKIKRDQEKVKAIRADKDTKVKVVDAKLIRQAKGGHGGQNSASKSKSKLSFFDEEYPSLGAKKPELKVDLKSDLKHLRYESTDTGSEWETEDEESEVKDPEVNLDNLELSKKIEVLTLSNEPKTFSSILKKPNPAIEELSDLISTCPVPKAVQANQNPGSKVKKKDPITFDIFAALKKKPQTQKSSGVLGSKIKPLGASRNILDSTAPAKRRGKEREKPKKKKPTTMKKLILNERESRKIERDQNLALSKITDDKEDESENCDKAENEVIEKEKVIEIPEQSNLEKAKVLLHSRKFRNYCDHELSNELDESAKNLIQDLVRFQDRQFAKDPIKAKAKKRYVVGLREIKKFLQVRKITILFLAPDVEPVKVKGGLDDVITELINLAIENQVSKFWN